MNNFTQAVVCDDLGMTNYIIHADSRVLDKDSMKHKEKADLLEGTLFIYICPDISVWNIWFTLASTVQMTELI